MVVDVENHQQTSGEHSVALMTESRYPSGFLSHGSIELKASCSESKEASSPERVNGRRTAHI